VCEREREHLRAIGAARRMSVEPERVTNLSSKPFVIAKALRLLRVCHSKALVIERVTKLPSKPFVTE
jgi:hypothetical protein